MRNSPISAGSRASATRSIVFDECDLINLRPILISHFSYIGKSQRDFGGGHGVPPQRASIATDWGGHGVPPLQSITATSNTRPGLISVGPINWFRERCCSVRLRQATSRNARRDKTHPAGASKAP